MAENERDDGGPAFPHAGIDHDGATLITGGMSLRDWFAGQALAGEVATSGGDTLSVATGETVQQALARDAKRRAEWCYAQAGAMIAARKNGGGNA